MARQWRGRMDGERYLANAHSGEVHDLDNEDTSWNGCEVDAIIAAGHDRPFNSLEEAHQAGSVNCARCLHASPNLSTPPSRGEPTTST